VIHPARAWARSVPARAAALAVALLVVGCGLTGPGRTSVALVPVDSASGHTWSWTVQCPFGPAAGPGCREAGPIIGFAQVNGDAWNLGGSANAGALDMSVSSHGAVTIEGRFASTPPCTEPTCLAPSALTWVRGYPDVSYGINQCHADTSPPESPQLPFPIRLDSIPARLIGVTAYSADTSGVTYDVAYDLWLHPTGTRRPCMSDGTLEIMVWTDYDERAVLPPSLQVGTANIPLAHDGVAMPRVHAWSIYASNIYRGGQTAAWGGTLWFVPDRADVVGHGRVSVDLTAVLSAAGHLLRDDYGWPDLSRHYWLDSAPFGVEFGPASGNPMDSGPSQFSLQISAYCLDVRTTLSAATCP
jgi:Glycosyl hydrolase family 12